MVNDCTLEPGNRLSLSNMCDDPAGDLLEIGK